MASVVRDPGGRKRILFFNAEGERKTLRLGKETMGNARTIAGRVELLVAAKRNGTVPEPAVIDWLASIGDILHAKLAEHGLVAPRVKAGRATLAAFLDSYIAGRSDVKGSTATVYGHTRRCLIDYFGADKALDAITPGDADDWRCWLGLAKNEEESESRRARVERCHGSPTLLYRQAILPGGRASAPACRKSVRRHEGH